MKHELRQYQISALNAIYESLKTDPLFLFHGITGCGKTLIICRLINRLFKETDKRFLVLINKMELVNQFVKTFLEQTNVTQFDLGVCSASLNQFDLSKRVTISTVQTFINRIDEYQGCDLLILDEAHNVSFGTGSQYDVVVEKLTDKVKNVRILGTTSTPYRLGFGYIYGDRCIKGGVNLFEKVGHQIKYEELRQQGYLCSLQGKIAHADSLTEDLSEVQVNGDYVINGISDVMCREIHLSTAVEAIHEHCMEYKHIAVFCTTISHAEKLKDLLGSDATTIHSQLSPLERQINMESWKSGKTKICTSINILAEGFDFPPLDCLVFARPTLSARLFLQAVGRVLRISDNKDHGFLLDLTDNVSKFGLDIDSVRINIPQSVVKEILKKDEFCKLCPSCEKEMFISLRICPNCGFEFPVEEIIEANHVPELTEVTFQKKEKIPPEWVPVYGMEVEMHESKKNGKFLGRIEFMFGSADYPSFVSMWLCLSDWYQGYAVTMAREKWEKLTDGTLPFPESVEELMDVRGELTTPSKILLEQEGKYPNIIDVGWEDGMGPGDKFTLEEQEYGENYEDDGSDIPF